MMEYLTSEIGIDGMLVARLPVFADRPEPHDDAQRARGQVRKIRVAVRQKGYRWLASPVYQDFLTGERKLPCAPWGSVTRKPVRLEGPVPLDGRDLPDVRGTHGRSRMGTVRARQRPSLRALRHSLGLRAVRDDRNHLESQGVGAKSRVDAPLTLACALAVEEKVARKAGARAARVGPARASPCPKGRSSRSGSRQPRPRARPGHARDREEGRRRLRRDVVGGRASRRCRRRARRHLRHD